MLCPNRRTRPTRPTPDTSAPADRCIACHMGVGADGTDVSIGFDCARDVWQRRSDPYFHAAVGAEIMDTGPPPAENRGQCSGCHMPWPAVAALRPPVREVFANRHRGATTLRPDLAADGVCSLCTRSNPTACAKEEIFTARPRFQLATPTRAAPSSAPSSWDEGGSPSESCIGHQLPPHARRALQLVGVRIVPRVITTPSARGTRVPRAISLSRMAGQHLRRGPRARAQLPGLPHARGRQ